jgi:hypothetical protein
MIPTIYTGKLRGVSVRFFPPPTDDGELMPWVAANELMSAMHLSRSLQDEKRINAPAGPTSVWYPSKASAIIKTAIRRGHVAASFEKKYNDHCWKAAQLIHPEMFFLHDNGKWAVDPESAARLLGVNCDEMIDFIEDHIDEIVKIGGLAFGPRGG